MKRLVATLPDSITELCLIRLGFQALRIRALPFALRLSRAIDRAAAEAEANDAGLLHSERFGVTWNHFGVLQYWRGYDELEAWSRRTPHTEWWRKAVDRGRAKGDFGVYHETFLVPRAAIETIYLDCATAPGLLSFGKIVAADGAMTTSRDRLGRRSRS
jgi:Domain of unknown function (DUF4188)